jgi:hypothetical protein
VVVCVLVVWEGLRKGSARREERAKRARAAPPSLDDADAPHTSAAARSRRGDPFLFAHQHTHTLNDDAILTTPLPTPSVGGRQPDDEANVPPLPPSSFFPSTTELRAARFRRSQMPPIENLYLLVTQICRARLWGPKQ